MRVGLGGTPGEGSRWHSDAKLRFGLGRDTVLRPDALALSGIQHARDVQRVRVGLLPHHGVEGRRALEAEGRIVGSAAQRALEELDGRLAVRQRASMQEHRGFGSVWIDRRRGGFGSVQEGAEQPPSRGLNDRRNRTHEQREDDPWHGFHEGKDGSLPWIADSQQSARKKIERHVTGMHE